MKNLKTTLQTVLWLLGASITANAQGALGTGDDGFVIQITSPASIAQTLVHGFDPGVCQWIGQTDWGADVTQELCGEVVWADDSLACGPLTNSNALAGKIALIRRGSCSFSLKTYNAQQAGAIAVIIINHYNNALDGPCTTYANATQFLGGMTAVDSAAAIHIPAVFLERSTGEDIDGALKAGQAVNVCFSFPRMTAPTSASMYATPLSQVDTMFAITVNYNNRSGVTQTDVNLKADFFNPSGTHIGSVSYHMPVCEPGVDSFIVFPPFFAAPELGKFKVLFTNDKYQQPIDSVYSYFEHTQYTFATDNLVNDPGGVGPSNDQFSSAGFYIQSGSLYLTGDAPAIVSHATFGISNIDSVYVAGDPTANIIGIAVYRADIDGDGAGDLSTSFIDDLGPGLVAYGEYEMTGNEQDGLLINAPLTDLNTGNFGVSLEANSAYYLSLIYDGTAAGTGRCVRFANSQDVDYASFTGYPTTPLYLGQLYTGGWNGAIVIERLQLLHFDAAVEPKLLAADKVKISPNPASDQLQLELKLDEVNPSVAVSMLDAKGTVVVNTRVEKNFQQGRMQFDVSQMPSGVYNMWIRTAEGSTMKRVVVAH